MQGNKFVHILCVIAELMVGLPVSRLASAQEENQTEKDNNAFTVEINPEYTTGKYGTRQRTNIFTVPITATYETGPYTFDVTVPYIRQTAPAGGIIIRGRPINLSGRRGAGNRIVTQQGVGDVLASVSRTVIEEDDSMPMVDLGFETKFGTASVKKGLGTGKNDYSPRVNFSKDWDRFTAQLTVGYTFIGKIPQVKLNNVVFGSADGSYKFNDESSSGLTFDVSTPSSPGVPPQQEFTLYVASELSKNTKLRFYVLKGITNASPDYGGGASVSVNF